MKREEQSQGFIDAVTKLTMRDIFFTALLYDLKIKVDNEGPIAATNGVFLQYNPAKFDPRPLEDRVFILAHEIMHVVLFHSSRRGIRNPKIWNIAADYVVNGLLSEDNGLKVPGDALLREDLFKGMSTEAVYDKLIKMSKENPDEGESVGDGSGGLLNGLDADWFDIKDYDPADNQGKSAAEHERDVGIRTASAAEAAKAAGKDTSTVRRFVAGVQVVKQPWYSQLQKYMVAMTAAEFNWAKPDFKRSMLYGGMICPKMASESLGKVIIGFDYSGSISDVQAGAMGTHCSDIMSDCQPSEVDVVYFDSEIKGNDVYTGPDYDLQMRAVGGGGTDFHPIIEYAEAADECHLLIIFTDMYGPMPDSCSVPVLWVVDSGEVASFGETIEADFND